MAFDSSQKAVLTSCVLRYKPVLNAGSSSSPIVSKATLSSLCLFSFFKPLTDIVGLGSTSSNGSVTAKKDDENQAMEEGFINCCFSFTIRRDKWGIPSMIVGNFIQC